jgi:hypothetical protein
MTDRVRFGVLGEDDCLKMRVCGNELLEITLQRLSLSLA